MRELDGLLLELDMSLEELTVVPRAMPEWTITEGDSLIQEKTLDELLEASRAIELTPMPGVSVKLSKFTEKQMSRANPLLRSKGRRKQHYQTRRRKLRERSRKQLAQYYRFKVRFGDRWQITLEEWQELLWPYVGGRPIRLGGYVEDSALTPVTVWIEDNRTGEKLWEGAEEKLRQDGYML